MATVKDLKMMFMFSISQSSTKNHEAMKGLCQKIAAEKAIIIVVKTI